MSVLSESTTKSQQAEIPCPHCQVSYRPRGLNRHIASCPRKPATVAEQLHTSQLQVDEPTQERKLQLEVVPLTTANLPAYEPVEKLPTTNYNNTPGVLFVNNVEKFYNTIICWRKKKFQTTSESAGKSYVKLLTTWLKYFNDNSTFKGIAMKVFMILP